MQNTLQIRMKTPKNRDLPHKITQFKHFSSRTHQKNRDIRCDFPEKSGKFIKLSIQLT